MRLTLRTLLAWLDAVLPAEEQVQLGEKVSASQTASLLAERIRLAVNRPAIAAPAPDARGLADDANSVADFLDNTLSADQLAAFERICLESDMHLAEVAACHAMLATLARQPAAGIAPATLQRLQTLLHDRLTRERFGNASGGPHAAGDGHNESRETARALRAALGTSDIFGDEAGGHGLAAPGHEAVSPAEGLQVDRTPAGAGHAAAGRGGRARSSPAAWWSAITAASLVLALVGVLGWRAFGGKSKAGAGSQRAESLERGPAPQNEDAAAATPAAAPAGADDAPPMPATVAAAAAPGGPDASSTPDPAPTAPPSETAAAGPARTEPGKALPQTAAPAQPAAGSVAATMTAGAAPRPDASNAPPSSGAAPAPPSTSPAPAVPVAAPVPILVGGGPLLRLVKQAGGEEWQHAAAGTSVLPGDELVVPPWGVAKLTAGGVEVTLLPLTDAVFLVDSDAAPRVDMMFGRCLVGGAEASRIGVTAGGLTGAVAAGPATRVAIDVGMDRPEAGEAAAPVAAGTGSITAGQRPFTWQPTAADGTVPAGAAPLEVPAGNAVVWRDGRASLAGTAPPSWIDATGFSDRVQKAAAETLVARISAGRPLLLSLREMTADRRVENRMLAAATLALIGQSDEMVELLEASPGNRSYLEDQQWLTLERMAVPAALARGGEAKAGLHRAIIKYAPPEQVDRLWAMARGLSDADITGGGDRMLVDSLDDPSLMVRRYAYKTLCDITRPSLTDRLRYRPDALPERRREGITWWRGQLQQGLIHR
jgi:hypothetical protein